MSDTIEAAVETITKEPVYGTVGELAFLLGFAITQAVVIELIGNHYIYSKKEYKDLCEKTVNLGDRIKTLKEEHMYGQA